MAHHRGEGTKTTRFFDLMNLLSSAPRSRRDLAERLGVSFSTITRYLQDLERMGYPLEYGRGSRGEALVSLKKVELPFSREEIVWLYNAALLMAAHLDRECALAAGMLAKIADRLTVAPSWFRALLREEADRMRSRRPSSPPVDEIFNTVSRAWLEGTMIELTYQAPHKPEKTYLCGILGIRPNLVGRSYYLITWCPELGDLRTFRVDRIRRVRQQGFTRFEPPRGIDLTARLSSAWNVWWGEEEEEVVLRFSRDVAYRVVETQWHEREEKAPQADGSIIWRARISEPREMLPWIRGWGKDVEVLSPQWLRENLAQEARAMYELYWGKCGEK